MTLDLDRLEGLMAEATPGPWNPCGANDSACECRLIWASERDLVVAVAGPTGAEDDPETREVTPPKEQRVANARLIAELRNAAPALIAAARESERLRALLERAVDEIEDPSFGSATPNKTARRAATMADIRAALGSKL